MSRTIPLLHIVILLSSLFILASYSMPVSSALLLDKGMDAKKGAESTSQALPAPAPNQQVQVASLTTSKSRKRHAPEEVASKAGKRRATSTTRAGSNPMPGNPPDNTNLGSVTQQSTSSGTRRESPKPKLNDQTKQLAQYTKEIAMLRAIPGFPDPTTRWLNLYRLIYDIVRNLGDEQANREKQGLQKERPNAYLKRSYDVKAEIKELESKEKMGLLAPEDPGLAAAREKYEKENYSSMVEIYNSQDPKRGKTLEMYRKEEMMVHTILIKLAGEEDPGGVLDRKWSQKKTYLVRRIRKKQSSKAN